MSPKTSAARARPVVAEKPHATRRVGLRPIRYLERRTMNVVALAAGDVLAIVVGFGAAGALRAWLYGFPLIPDWSWLVPLAWVCGALSLTLLPGWGLGAVEELRRSVLLMSGIFAVTATILFIGKTGASYSRLTLTLSFAFSLPLLLLVRRWVKTALIRRGIWGIPAVVYGAAETARLAIRVLREDRGLGYVPVGIFEDDVPAGEIVEGVPVLGPTCDTAHAPAAIVAMPDISRHRLVDLLEGPLSGYRRVVVIPDLLEAPTLWVKARDMGGILGLEVTHNLEDPLSRATKRAVDLVATLLTAPIWLPLCAIVAFAVWLQDGRNPLFAQQRAGGDGRLFRTWKFRTMVPDAESVLRRKLDDDPTFRAEWEREFKVRHDPRVTRLGVILRKSSLDELPQLINVLAGHMSLVGPRPLPAYHYEELPQRVRRIRERVRPGITGLWQVSGRSESGTAGMERWDSYYVRNWSVWLDVVILVRTFRAVIGGHGAY